MARSMWLVADNHRHVADCHNLWFVILYDDGTVMSDGAKTRMSWLA